MTNSARKRRSALGDGAVDLAKSRALKAELSTRPVPQVVPIARFFDGNDDLGSIGRNLNRHPGIEIFRKVFFGLLNRPDVIAVYAQISELDPGEDCWLFADTILVVGSISTDELHKVVVMLQPDEVGEAAQFGVCPEIDEHRGCPVLVIWWD